MKRRRIWFQEQLQSGTMDKSQIYLIYTKKKLPCDLQRKAKPDNTTLAALAGSSGSHPVNRRKSKLQEIQQFSEVSITDQHLTEVSICDNYSQSESSMVVTPFVDAGIDSISGLQDHIDFIVNADGYWKMEKLQQEY